MRFHTRKWVKPEDLNPNGTLFGGQLLAWIDEEAALYTIIQLENPKIVTKYMSEINFMASAKKGDIKYRRPGVDGEIDYHVFTKSEAYEYVKKYLEELESENKIKKEVETNAIYWMLK